MPDDAGGSCPICKRPFDTARGLSIHLTRSGHGKEAKARALVDRMQATAARPVPCTFPGCRAGFQSRLGLRIHQTLKGHQRIRDSLVRGDGPQPEPRVRSSRTAATVTTGTGTTTWTFPPSMMVKSITSSTTGAPCCDACGSGAHNCGQVTVG